MTRSKKLFQLVKTVIAISLMGSTISCVKAQKQTGGPGTGGPRVFNFSRSGVKVDLTGYAAEQIASSNIQVERSSFTGVISDQANYGDRREYNLSMCGLSDIRMSSNKLLGQRFEIFSELEIHAQPDGGRVATVTSDDCVRWTVMLPFDPFAGSVNLYVNFIFRTVGGARTYIHRTVLFNPWDQQRGSNPEFFDFTRHGLTPQMSRLPLAIGQDEIYLALSGEGKFRGTNRKLEIGSVNIMPVKKDDKTGRYVSPGNSGEARKYVNGNGLPVQDGSIQALTDAAFQRIRDIRISAAEENSNSPEIRDLQTLDLNLNIRLSDLKIRLKDSAGVVSSESDMSLPTGQYKIHAQLVASGTGDNSGKYEIISSRIPCTSTDAPAGTHPYSTSCYPLWNTQTMGVNAVIPLVLVARPGWGNISLVLKVEPTSVPLEAFEAIYNLGSFADIGRGASPIFDLGEFSRDIEGNLAFSFDSYLSGAKNYTQWLAGHPESGIEAGSIEQGFRRFRFTHLDVLFSRVVPGDTSTDRTIQYTVKTCLQDTFFGNTPQAGLRFDIKTDDRGVDINIPNQKTDDQGCLSWVGMISHKYYHRERLIPKESTLTFLGEGKRGQVQKLKYYINPWDEKFTFGRDERVLPQYYIDQINRGQAVAPPTRLLVTEFKYDAIGFRYVVDKFMNLTVKKTVLLDLRPKILKYNSIIWGRSGFGELRDGIYLLKVAMQKDYLDPAAPHRRINYDKDTGRTTIPYNTEDSEIKRVFLTVKEVLVRVLGGHIVTPVEFDINDLRTLRLRSQMFIQLETIDEMLLRAVMMIDNRLSERLNQASTLTLDVRNRQLTDDQLASEIDALLVQAKNAADQKEIQERIRQLQSAQNSNLAKLRALLSGLDQATVMAVLADVERIGRDGGQSPESVQGNIRRRALQELIDIQKKIAREYANTGIMQRRSMQDSYAQEKLAQCQAMQQRLRSEGDARTAALFDPNVQNTLCPLDIPDDQMFYFLTSRQDIGSERWLKEILTPAELETYYNSLFPGHSEEINNEVVDVLRDDFTGAYLPNYDFNLLSNQGDELAEGANPLLVSGLSRRTFMGPVTFVLNGNGSAMRPTDVLDEASCGRTCEQLADIDIIESISAGASQDVINTIQDYGSNVNEDYEKNPYFGYVGQFYKKQVDDLIPMYHGVQRIYREEMKAFSTDGYFVDSLMLDHVRLTNANTESLKTMDVNCYATWKDDIEKLYVQWRDLNQNTVVNINIPPIPETCFKTTARSVAPSSFMDRVNAIVPRPPTKDLAWTEMSRWDMINAGNDPYYFIRPTNEYDYGSNLVTAAEMKEFAKNGVRSVRLSLASKEKILHHMCYLTREIVAPQGDMVLQIYLDRLNQNIIRGQPVGTGFSEFLRKKLDRMENRCHGHVASYVNSVKSAGRMSPKAQAVLMSSLAKHLPFNLERRVRVLNTTNRYMYQDGKTLNYSVSKSFGIDGGFRSGRGRKMEFDGDKILNGLAAGAAGAATGAALTSWLGPGAFLGAAAGGAVGVISGIIGAGSGMAGLNIEWTEGDGMSTSNGTGVSSGTTLAAQISTLDIELGRFEKCMVLKPSTDFLVETRKDIDGELDEEGFFQGFWGSSDNSRSDTFKSYRFIKDFKKAGYFVCSGEIQTEDDLNVGNTLRVRENYYYFTQIFNDGDMQDPGELVNHPWMLMLRGQRDFAAFEQALMIPQQLDWGVARDQQMNDMGLSALTTSDRVNGREFHNMPTFNRPEDTEVVGPNDISMALDMMQKGFESALPAVPGMFTFSDYESDGVSNWPQGSTVVPRATTPALQAPRRGR